MPHLLALVRFVHLASLSLLVGTLAFRRLVAGPALSRLDGSREGERLRLDRWLHGSAVWSLWTGLVSALAWLLIQGAVMSGRPLGQAMSAQNIWTVLARTAFGHVWSLRLGLLAVLGYVLLSRSRARTEPGLSAFRLTEGLLAGAAMATLAWIGHASATEGEARLPYLALDCLHLLATGAWLGGLFPLTIFLRAALRSRDARWSAAAVTVVRRFSLLGLLCVVVLILSGLASTSLLVGSLPALIGTPYGKLLLLKLALIAVAIGAAAHNRIRLMPDILRPAPASTLDEPLRQLKRNVLVETSAGAVVLLLVGFLGVTPPALHAQPMWPFLVRPIGRPSLITGPEAWPVLLTGGLLLLIGLFAIVRTGLRRRYCWGAVALGLGLMTFSAPRTWRELTVEAYPTTYWHSTAAFDAVSIASGFRAYQSYCAACHGPDGHGDGSAGRLLRPAPADLTARHTGDHTVGDLFWWLSHGIQGSAMPGFQERLSETERWDLVNFLRALPAGAQTGRLGPGLEPTAWLAAPDFTFETPDGSPARLREQRGKAVVLLVLFSLPASRPRLSQLDAARSALAAAGAQVIAVPMQPVTLADFRAELPAFSLAADEGQEVAMAYALFCRGKQRDDPSSPPRHLEFLVDRQGFVRARWIPERESGWGEIPRLLVEVAQLAHEPPHAVEPEEHIH